MEVACSLSRPPPDRVAVANMQRRLDVEQDFLELSATYQDVHFKLLRLAARRNNFCYFHESIILKYVV